jgi:uncharacterized phiE125 gp8 family phage protein
MNVITITPAASLPVSLDSVKLYMDLRHSEFDAVLEEAIRSSVSIVEQSIELAIMERTLELRLDDWPGTRVIELPYAPLVSVSSVKYISGGVERTLDGIYYTAVPETNSRGRVVAKSGFIWPFTDSEPETVRIRYVVGMASSVANVPADVAQTIKEITHRLFDSRGAVNVNDLKRYAVQSLCNYRAWRF